MFFFANARQKALKRAKTLVWMAKKIDDYRRDVLPEADLARLRESAAALKALCAKKPVDVAALDRACEALDAAMRPCGGDFYPVTWWAENTETFMVAALVVLALRCFVVQPFKIPTNSMFPSYAGLTSVVHAEPPSPLSRAVDFVRYLATPTTVVAPADGEVLIPLSSMGALDYRVVPARDWLVLPGQRREYALYVGGEPVTFKTPVEFGMEQTYLDAFFPNENRKDPATAYRNLCMGDARRGKFLHTGKFVRKGEPILSFDIRTGDMLLVDRVRYHFTSPKVGDPVVFPTKRVPGLGETEDVYYIKRLVGLPGDVLEVRGTTLYRNGAPIEGAAAFDANARQLDKFPGYQAVGRLEAGRTLTVPQGYYFVMGDNSPMSYDGRLWKYSNAARALTDAPSLGFVPEKEIIGTAVFILYPISERWGLAK